MIKPVHLLDREAELLAERLGARLAGCRVVGSSLAAAFVRPDFSCFPAHGVGITAARRHALVCRTVCRVESSASLYLHQQPGIFRSAWIPSFLRHPFRCFSLLAVSCRGRMYNTPQAGCASGLMKSTAARKPASSPGVTANKSNAAGFYLPVDLQTERRCVGFTLIAEDNGLLLDDILQLSEDGQFHLMGRRGRIVKLKKNVFHSRK